MFHQPPPARARIPNRMKNHQHHISKSWIRLPAHERCLECYPTPRPFLLTAFGKIPPEIRAIIFQDVLTVGSLTPLKDGISVSMAKPRNSPQPQSTAYPAGPASCLAILQTCRQIYNETAHLFYTRNTLHLNKPQDLLSFLRQIGTEQCGELRSLHLEDMLVPTPIYSQGYLDFLRSELDYTDDRLARISSLRIDKAHPDARIAVQLLNKRSNLRKIYLNLRPSEALQYIELCTRIIGFKHRQITFASPTHWSMMAPCPRTRHWWRTFLVNTRKNPSQAGDYRAYWEGDEKYRVEVDILPTLPEKAAEGSACLRHNHSVDCENGDGNSVDTAMEGLSLL